MVEETNQQMLAGCLNVSTSQYRESGQLTKVNIDIPNPRVPLKNAEMPIANASPDQTSPAT
jgi:hypothetical protein